ncbi:MAG: flippase [Candidatus Nealsonbacteria bacterium]|nr:flippase [Candidatus Nealsonbacteria bacterium]
MKLEALSNVKKFLFDNTTVRQTISKNYFWLIAGAGINKLLKMVLIIYAARILGVTEYGKFSFALAFVSLFIVFHDFGLPATITREFAREKEKEKEFYSVLSFTALLAVVALTLILSGSFFITQDPGIRIIILILALFSLINGFAVVFYAFFQARQRMEYQMWAETLQSILVVGMGLFVLFKMPSVENFSYSYLFAAIISFIFVLFFFNFKIFPLRICWEKSVWKKFFIMALPLGLAGSFGSLYSYTDSVIMGYLGMINETGWYNAAYRISFTAFIFIGLISSSFYPVLSENFRKSKEMLQKVWNYEIEIIIILVFLFVTGGIVLASKIINFAYGPAFFPSILAFQILIVTTGITLFYTTLKDLLIVANLQKKFFIAIAAGAIINIILNLILIPRYSLYGSAVATTITHSLILITLAIFILKYTSIRLSIRKVGLTALISLISSFAMYFIISRPEIYNLNVFISIIIGAAIYFLAFFSLRYSFKKLLLCLN